MTRDEWIKKAKAWERKANQARKSDDKSKLIDYVSLAHQCWLNAGDAENPPKSHNRNGTPD